MAPGSPVLACEPSSPHGRVTVPSSSTSHLPPVAEGLSRGGTTTFATTVLCSPGYRHATSGAATCQLSGTPSRWRFRSRLRVLGGISTPTAGGEHGHDVEPHDTAVQVYQKP